MFHLTEMFWETFHYCIGQRLKTYTSKCNEHQIKFNEALYYLNVHWKQYVKHNGCKQGEPWFGNGNKGLSVVILPPSVIYYRRACQNATIHTKPSQSHHVRHHCSHLSEDGKLVYASSAGLWYLREDWEDITRGTPAVGGEWLKSIAAL